MVEFKLVPHTIRPNVMAVEVWIDGQRSAVIYPGESGDTITVNSRHIADARLEQWADVTGQQHKTYHFLFSKDLVQ